MRPKGVCLMTSWPRSVYVPSGLVSSDLFCSVMKKPGAMAFTLTVSPNFLAHSCAM